jgi:hypothetical protein
MLIDKNDIITCESYKTICDYVYHPDNQDPQPGLVHVNFEEIPDFFKTIVNFPERNYVIVSSCSDFGLAIQAYNPVWADMSKWARVMSNPELGYKNTVIPPRCDVHRCNLQDKYSVRCYSYTAYTFNEIPNNIKHWFMTNARVPENDFITIIPFGVAANAQDDIMEVAEEKHKQEPKLYINWVNYTVERLEIREFYRLINSVSKNVTIIDEAKPYKDYLRDLASHACILSPEGNGVDCYRNLESIYMNSMPFVQLSETTHALSDLPIAIVKTMFGLRANESYDVSLKIREYTKLDKSRLSYWKNRFGECRKNV